MAKRGRPKGSKNKKGHHAGRPKGRKTPPKNIIYKGYRYHRGNRKRKYKRRR